MNSIRSENAPGNMFDRTRLGCNLQLWPPYCCLRAKMDHFPVSKIVQMTSKTQG